MPNKLLAVAALFGIAAQMGCGPDTAHGAATGGNVEAGAVALVQYGCGSCHTIKGIGNARGLVGPPLTGLRDRTYVAGMLINTPGNLTYWIQRPKSVNPRTAMPDLGVTAHDATNIAAYLYSLN